MNKSIVSVSATPLSKVFPKLAPTVAPMFAAAAAAQTVVPTPTVVPVAQTVVHDPWTFDVAFFSQPTSRGRIMYAMPQSWPVVSRPVYDGYSKSSGVKTSLDNMTATKAFKYLVEALKSDPFWYTDEMRATYPPPEDGDEPVFSASIIVAKQVLHFTYSLDTGLMNLGRVADGLNLATVLHGSTIVDASCLTRATTHDFAHFAGPAGHVTVWQTMRAMVAETLRFAILHEASSKAIDAVVNEVPVAFPQSTAYNLDSFGYLLRTASCMTGAIQAMHLDILRSSSKFVPKAFVGFKRVEAPKGDQMWRNYLFDVAAMWMSIQTVAQALKKGPEEGANALVHALQKARIWSLCSGIAGSAALLSTTDAFIGDDLRAALRHVSQLGLVLHSTYLRLWDVAFKCLNVAAHGSVMALKRALERMCAYAFVSSASAKTDVPDCGTATLVDNGPISTLTAEQVGLVSYFNGRDRPCLGALEADINFSVFVGLLAPALTQSKAHLWAAVTSDKAWSQMDQGLPKKPDVERVTQWLSGTWSASWVLTLPELQAETKAFKKTYWRNQEAAQDQEIEAILASL